MKKENYITEVFRALEETKIQKLKQGGMCERVTESVRKRACEMRLTGGRRAELQFCLLASLHLWRVEQSR